MWHWFEVPKKRRPTKSTSHFKQHKETARKEILTRLTHWNQYYNFSYNRVAIRNQRRRWGSCSSLKNLNFNYKLILLPDHLHDYVIVHELCHLKEMNHGRNFWLEVAKTIPDYKNRVQELRQIEYQYGISIAGLIKAREHYQARATTPAPPRSDGATRHQQWLQ